MRNVWSVQRSTGSRLDGMSIFRRVGFRTDGRPSVSPVHSKPTCNTVTGPAHSWGRVGEKEEKPRQLCHE